VSLIDTGVLSIAVWWVVRAASIIRAMMMMMEAARTSETSVDNYFTR
jgi:ribosomal protein S19E (S16A)